MNSNERLEAVLSGATVDRPPFSFWYNFGLQHMSGEAIADAHIAFANRFKPDFLRVISGYPYPLSGVRSFERVSDFLQIPKAAAEEGFWSSQLLALEKIVKAMRGQTWVVDSVDSPWTVLCKLSSPQMVLNAAVRRPEMVKVALDIISSSQAKYVEKAMGLGIKGIFFTIAEAGHDVLDPIGHEEICLPYNQRVLAAAGSAPFNILRIESRRPYFDTLQVYNTQVVSWPHFTAKQSLRSGAAEWKRCVLGGINHETVSWESPNNLSAYFEQYAEEFFQPNLIIGPSGVLPTDISLYVLDGLTDAINNLSQIGRFLRKESARSQNGIQRNVEDNYAGMAKRELRNSRQTEKPIFEVIEGPEKAHRSENNLRVEDKDMAAESKPSSAAGVAENSRASGGRGPEVSVVSEAIGGHSEIDTSEVKEVVSKASVGGAKPENGENISASHGLDEAEAPVSLGEQDFSEEAEVREVRPRRREPDRTVWRDEGEYGGNAGREHGFGNSDAEDERIKQEEREGRAEREDWQQAPRWAASRVPRRDYREERDGGRRREKPDNKEARRFDAAYRRDERGEGDSRWGERGRFKRDGGSQRGERGSSRHGNKQNRTERERKSLRGGREPYRGKSGHGDSYGRNGSAYRDGRSEQPRRGSGARRDDRRSDSRRDGRENRGYGNEHSERQNRRQENSRSGGVKRIRIFRSGNR